MQYAGSMQAVYRQYAGSMQAIWRQYAGSMHAVCRQYGGRFGVNFKSQFKNPFINK
jgi:hypothetical protein